MRRHGVSRLAIDVQRSEWDCTLVCDRHGELARQLGLRLLQGFPQAVAEHLVRTRPATGLRALRRCVSTLDWINGSVLCWRIAARSNHWLSSAAKRAGQ